MFNYQLEVKNLKVHFPVLGGLFWRQVGTVYAVDGVSFNIEKGTTLGLVGESGCGKTTVGRCVCKLIEPTNGEIFFNSKNITKLKNKQIKEFRTKVQMIFQDPFESLNPRHTIAYILEEPFIVNSSLKSYERNKKILDLLDKVGLSKRVLGNFPHEFSGGQRQRIGIARAISQNPELVICDESVSALDVSIQAQILNLLLDLQKEMNLSYLFIAHDMSVVKHVSDHVAVMYLGKIVEYGQADIIYKKHLHPYTNALISAIPISDPLKRKKKIIAKGDVPSPLNPPAGCRFSTRCHMVDNICKKQEPMLISKNNKDNKKDIHFVACHKV